jgi:hypothetical protein
MNSELAQYLAKAAWSAARERRMVAGLSVLQEIARRGDRPVTYKDFAGRLQKGLAPLATASVLGDIGRFCNDVGWPNLTCFVVSASTGECSEGFRQISSEDPAVARDRAWFAYAVYKAGPLVDQG